MQFFPKGEKMAVWCTCSFINSKKNAFENDALFHMWTLTIKKDGVWECYRMCFYSISYPQRNTPANHKIDMIGIGMPLKEWVHSKHFPT